MTYDGPFNDDIVLQEAVCTLIREYHVRFAVETGTYKHGHTAAFLAGLVERVHTVEVNKEYYDASGENLKACPNVVRHLGRSQVKLGRIIRELQAAQSLSWTPGTRSDIPFQEAVQPVTPILYFLDAHWQAENPLLQELDIIAEFDPQPLIMIHDMKVPGRYDLGFDTYGGQDYDYAWVEPSLRKIKGPWVSRYNSVATGAKRGVLFVLPRSAEVLTRASL